MIKKIQYKFIGIASISLFIVLVTIISILNSIYYVKVHDRLYETLEVIYNNNGNLPQRRIEQIDIYNKETSFQTRYFIVDINKNQYQVDLKHIALINKNQAIEFSKQAIKKSNNKGSIKNNINHYVYRVYKQSNGYRVIFIDATNELTLENQLLQQSILLGSAAFIFFVLIVLLLSKKAISPIINNYQKQSEFITNAGHELKTPLTVIKANMEVLEMMQGKNEWITSTMNQTNRLSSLVNDLIALVRFKEKELSITEINCTLLGNEILKDFETIASQKNIQFHYYIQKDCIYYTDKNSLEELINILTDNAIKYCDENGRIDIKLMKKGRKLLYQITNDYQEGNNVDYSHFFERFYRQDKSHNHEIKGFGIGLSMAKTITESLKGKINVSYKNKRITFEVLL